MAVTPRLNSPQANMVNEVAELAALEQVRAAGEWFRAHEEQVSNWQLALARVPAPPFGEAERADWLRARLREMGLNDVRLDEIGNVVAVRPGTAARQRYVAVSAHLDTVFPAGTQLNVYRDGKRLFGPGISDNGAGVSALLALAGALHASEIQTSAALLLIGNVGEEGEGDLRGMRHLFSNPHWKENIAYTLVLDGAGTDTIVAEALGSRRFELTVRGPGGHSWSDFGTLNPIIVLSRAVQKFSETRVPTTPKTTFNVGVIQGGTSVNSIPESASMRVDIRSTSSTEIERLERALRASLDYALAEESSALDGRTVASRVGVSSEAKVIGNRPAGDLASNARILQVIRAVDTYLENSSHIQRASTDANVPLSLGMEAIAIGAGGSGGGAHTLHEWFDTTGRELGLQRILLTTLALAGVRG
jgi:acetylornithine deacetylase/succinyl-diaminopimelate desuccinylase-like protein